MHRQSIILCVLLGAEDRCLDAEDRVGPVCVCVGVPAVKALVRKRPLNEQVERFTTLILQGLMSMGALSFFFVGGSQMSFIRSNVHAHIRQRQMTLLLTNLAV